MLVLDPAASARGFRLTALDEVDSTNAEALRRGRMGDGGPLWVVAKVQTAGRGRRGRSWASPDGNLFASLLLTETASPERASLLGLVAGLAVTDAVTACAPDLDGRLALKWPNDVLAGTAKLAGILIEAESLPDGATRLAIGQGINCQIHPGDMPYAVASLRGLGLDITTGTLFTALSGAWAGWLDVWRGADGFSRVRDAWLDRAAGLGASITVRLPDRELTGRFEDIDRQGRLILRKVDGTRQSVGYGEVFLRPEAGR